jgi:hypothetical protein
MRVGGPASETLQGSKPRVVRLWPESADLWGFADRLNRGEWSEQRIGGRAGSGVCAEDRRIGVELGLNETKGREIGGAGRREKGRGAGEDFDEAHAPAAAGTDLGRGWSVVAIGGVAVRAVGPQGSSRGSRPLAQRGRPLCPAAAKPANERRRRTLQRRSAIRVLRDLRPQASISSTPSSTATGTSTTIIVPAAVLQERLPPSISPTAPPRDPSRLICADPCLAAGRRVWHVTRSRAGQAQASMPSGCRAGAGTIGRNLCK